MMQDRTFRGQSADGVWHEGFLIRSPGVKNSRPGEGWYINSEQEPAYAHLVKPFTIGICTGYGRVYDEKSSGRVMQNVALDCAGGSGGDGCTSDLCGVLRGW